MENTTAAAAAAAAAADPNDAVELPAPPGWKKKFTPRKSGTPKRNDVLFISPTGEEIKNKSQLNKYLKSNPGNPSASDFDWGTGTPRRSARLGEKSKEMDTSGSDPPKKRQRKLNLKGTAKEESAEGEADTTEEDVTEEVTKGSAPDVHGEKEIVDTTEDKDVTEEETKGSAEPDVHGEKEIVDTTENKDDEKEILAEEVHSEGDKAKDDEKETSDRETITEKPIESEDKMEIEQKEEKLEETKGTAEPGVHSQGDNVKDAEKETNDREIITEEPPESKDKMEIKQKKEEILDVAIEEETKGSAEPEVQGEKEIVTEEVQPEGDNVNDDEKKINEREIAIEEPPPSGDQMEIEQENKEKLDEAADTFFYNNQDIENTGLEEILAESKPTEMDLLFQEESATGADAYAQMKNSNDAKLEEEKQLNKENPDDNTNGTEAGSVNPVENQQKEQNTENSSAKQEGNIAYQVISS